MPWLESVHPPGDFLHLSELSSRDIGDLNCSARAEHTNVGGRRSAKAFYTCEEVDFIFDDRATKAQSISGLTKITGASFWPRSSTGKIFIRISRKQISVKVVGSRLGYDIDISAEEFSVTNIEGRGLNGNFLNSCEGNGTSPGWKAARVEAKIVILTNSINRNTVESVVRTANTNSIAIGIVDNGVWT